MRRDVPQTGVSEALPREGSLRQDSGVRRWFVPDLALVASLVTLFYCLFLFEGYQKLFRDSDSGWHIRVGESMLSTGQLPRTDPYSFSLGARPWFAWEWGADVLMGAAHRLAGLSGVAFLYGLAIAAGVWLWFRLNWIAEGNFLLACALAAPMLTTAGIHWLARPHVLSWVFLLLAVTAAERRPRLVWIGLGSALWANIHASFFLAPVLAGLYALAHVARPLIWDADRDREWGQARWYGLAAAVSAVSTLVNPYGWNLHRHVITYLSDSELLARIGEFQSFNFHADGALQIGLAMGVAWMGGILALGQGKLAHFLLVALIAGAALRSARGLPLVGLLLLPLANGAITRGLANWQGLQSRLRRGIDSFLAYSSRLRELDRGGSGLAWAPVAAVFVFLMLKTPGIAARTGFPPDQFPVAAAGRLPENARLLAPDKFGGYLIYRFAGKRQVFFDGRS
ncbi:MAG: hypothetical protein HY013_12095, partial [Candidatus Solibacter usitatus]|nr:hypothetical protein [Candidatus Solibacter usitatus]